MYSEPRKIVFTGLVVGAVAIGVGAYVSHSDEEWLPLDELGVSHGGGRGTLARGNTTSGVVRSGPLDGQSDPTSTKANSLKASRNSLLRDDVAAARAELNAISPAYREDRQVLALQKDIQTRAELDRRATTIDAQVDKAPARSLAPSAVKTAHPRDAQLASREYSNRASGYARNRRGVEAGVAKSGGAGGSGAPAVNVAAARTMPMASQSAHAAPVMNVVRGPAAPAAVNSSPLLQQPTAAPAQSSTQTSVQQAAPEPLQSAQSAPSTPQPEMTAQAVLPAAVFQTSVPHAPVLQSDGPKTRAQVRAEIVHAREDGSLPAFGNPDPAGPGGAPSMTLAPRP